MTKFQEINNALRNTRFFLIYENDNATTIRKNLATKFDSDDKKYGTMFAYFVPNDKLNELFDAMKKKNFDEDIQKLLDKYCQFGFEILDMSLRERINHVTNDVTLNVYPFAEWVSTMTENINGDITDTAKFLEQMRRIGIAEYKNIQTKTNKKEKYANNKDENNDANMVLWNELKKHRGHKVSIVSYGDWDNPADICLECEDCGDVVLDAEIYTLCARENN